MQLNTADILLIVVIACCLLLALRSIMKSRKKGGCGCGCDGCSAPCGTLKGKENTFQKRL